jgi:CHAT domain-containing protein
VGAQEARFNQLMQQAEQLRQQNQLNQAVTVAFEAQKVALATFGPNDVRVGVGYLKLGELYKLLDGFADADTCFHHALDIFKAAGSSETKNLSAVFLDLADMYADHGRWGEAETDFRQAMDAAIAAYGKEDPHVGEIMRDGASLLISEGKLQDAVRMLRGAIAEYTLAGPAWRSQLAVTWNLVGQCVADAGAPKEAETYFQNAIQLSEQADGPDNAALADYLGNLANVYKDEQRFADGEPLYLRMIDIMSRKYGIDNPILDENDLNVALFYYAWDKPDRAAPWFDRFIAARLTLWSANAYSMSEQDRLVYYATLPGTFPIYFSFIAKYHDRYPELAGKMYNALLAERGSVAESATANRARLLASGNRQAIALFDKLTAEKAQFASLASSGTDNKVQIKQLSDLINQTEEALAEASGDHTLQKANAVVRWQDIQKALKPGEAAVEITRFQFNNGRSFTSQFLYVALIITSRTQNPNLIVLGDAKQLEATPLTNFRNVVARTRGLGVVDEPTNTTASAADAAPVDASAAYTAYWKPIEPALAGVQRVYLATDGALNQIPIGLLSDSTGKLLLEKYQLHYVNSTRDLLSTQTAATSKSAVLLGNPKFDLVTSVQNAATGRAQSPASQRGVDIRGGPLPPLPGTEAEVTTIDKLLRQSGWQTTLYTGDRALKTSIQSVQAPRIVHIATHGFFLEDHPAPDKSGRIVHLQGATDDPMLHSGLLFAGADGARSGTAPAGGDNGVLTAYEASQLNLEGTELVVLSACETGLGGQSNSEGVFGLRRALQEAGASAVMMSMWSVPDKETQELMALFYKYWLGGLEKPEALRKAQLEEREVVRKRYGQDLPYYWGAFVMVSR